MIEFEQGERTEPIDWLEIRRETVVHLTSPINLLAQEIGNIKEKRVALQDAHQPNQSNLDNELTNMEITLENTLDLLLRSMHLTVGGRSCACNRCMSMATPFNQDMPGSIVKYRKV